MDPTTQSWIGVRKWMDGFLCSSLSSCKTFLIALSLTEAAAEVADQEV